MKQTIGTLGQLAEKVVRAGRGVILLSLILSLSACSGEEQLSAQDVAVPSETTPLTQNANKQELLAPIATPSSVAGQPRTSSAVVTGSATLATAPGSMLTPSHMPEPGAEPTTTPAPTLVPTPTPTPTPSPTLTPTPAPTSTPTPTPSPTPNPALVAAIQMSEIIPWWRDRPDLFHSDAAKHLLRLWLLDPELGEALARKPWVADGVVIDENAILNNLAVIGDRDPQTARYISESPWLQGPVTEVDGKTMGTLERISSWDTDAARRLTQLDWMGQRLSDEFDHYTFLVRYLEYLQEHPEKANALLQTTWFYQGPEYAGEEHFFVAMNLLRTYPTGGLFLGYLHWLGNDYQDDAHDDAIYAMGSISELDPLLAESIANINWVIDGISPLEGEVLKLIGEGAQTDPDTAWEMVESVFYSLTLEDLRRLQEW